MLYSSALSAVMTQDVSFHCIPLKHILTSSYLKSGLVKIESIIFGLDQDELSYTAFDFALPSRVAEILRKGGGVGSCTPYRRVVRVKFVTLLGEGDMISECTGR